MLNVKSDEFDRRKNFYNWELCKSGLRDFLETTRKYGLVQDYFKHRDYNERLHAHCMLEHLESHVSFHFSYQSFIHFVQTRKRETSAQKITVHDPSPFGESKKGNLSSQVANEPFVVTKKSPGLAKLVRLFAFTVMVNNDPLFRKNHLMKTNKNFCLLM